MFYGGGYSSQNNVGPETNDDVQPFDNHPLSSFKRTSPAANNLFSYTSMLPDCPHAVRALGRDESAAVWWTYDKSSPNSVPITCWEIKRYRLESSGVWTCKGFTKLTDKNGLNQVF